MTKFAEELLMEFLTQKLDLAKRAGVKHTPVPNWHRAVKLWGSHMSTVADLAKDWNIPASIIMQAAFDQARRNKHPDGPQVTMLKSERYLTNALSYFLDVPAALVRERRSIPLMLEFMDKDFAEITFPQDLLMFTGENPCFRYVEARRRGEDIVAAVLAPTVLERIAEDRRMDAWLTHRGYPFLDVAVHYNELAPTLMFAPIDTNKPHNRLCLQDQ